MYLLATQLTVLEVAIFLLAAFAFIIAVRFFIESRKHLEQFFAEQQKPVKKSSITIFDNLVFITKRFRRKTFKPTTFLSNTRIATDNDSSSEEINNLRSMLLHQQSQLSKALVQINNLGNERTERTEDFSSTKKVKELELTLEKKEGEIKKLKQQSELSKKMQEHFEKMQKDFALLQQKLQKLEQQAWESNELTIKLDNLQQSHVKVEKDLLKKDEKIRDLANENQRVQSLLHETEDKLQEANLQRQQQMKKLQFLEEMNGDMKEISDANKKLQTEIRRIAELESMLNLITEERDELLKKKRK